jgi:steroid delta-isomerase-like uncharacterized protein
VRDYGAKNGDYQARKILNSAMRQENAGLQGPGFYNRSMEQHAATRELLRKYYGFFNEGRFEEMLSLLTDDVVHDINQGASERGIEAFRTFSQRMERCYRETLTDLQLFVSDDGRRAAAEFLVQGTYLGTDEGLPEASGQTYALPAGAFFDISQGKISRVTMYYNLNDWLRQVRAF